MAIRSYRANGWNDNLNLVVYVSLVLSAIGVTWLALNDIPTGIRYITIFLVAVALMVISFLFINEQQQLTIKKLFKNPFTTDYDVATAMYLLGWTVPIVLNLIIGFFTRQRFNISQLMIPLSATDINQDITQSFNVAEAQANPFFQWLVNVFTAGTIEEFAFGFVLALVGVMVGMLLWRLLFTGSNPSSNGARAFYLITSFIVTGGIFSGMHNLNANYVGLFMFSMAVLFRIGMNYAIYVVGVFLSFTIGYHQSNNAVWYWYEYGAGATIGAIQSVGGVLLLLYFGVLVFFALRRVDVIWEKLGRLFTEVRR